MKDFQDFAFLCSENWEMFVEFLFFVMFLDIGWPRKLVEGENARNCGRFREGIHQISWGKSCIRNVFVIGNLH